MAAVTPAGIALDYASESLTNNKQVALVAIDSDASAYVSIGPLLEDDKELALLALKQDLNIYERLNKTLQGDADILRLLCKSIRKVVLYQLAYQVIAHEHVKDWFPLCHFTKEFMKQNRLFFMSCWLDRTSSKFQIRGKCRQYKCDIIIEINKA
jgi:hypothetical protein